METTVITLAIALTIILGWMVVIVTNDNQKRFNVLKRLKRGDTCRIIYNQKQKKVLILRNLVDEKILVCRLFGFPTNFSYEEVVIDKEYLNIKNKKL